ncbi:putative Atp-dependent transporter, partial [Daphnia magna]
GRAIERPGRGNLARPGRRVAGVCQARSWSSATTAGSWTALRRTFWLPKATASGCSLTATTRNTKLTRNAVWAKKVPSPSACASRL